MMPISHLIVHLYQCVFYFIYYIFCVDDLPLTQWPGSIFFSFGKPFPAGKGKWKIKSNPNKKHKHVSPTFSDSLSLVESADQIQLSRIKYRNLLIYNFSSRQDITLNLQAFTIIYEVSLSSSVNGFSVLA